MQQSNCNVTCSSVPLSTVYGTFFIGSNHLLIKSTVRFQELSFLSSRKLTVYGFFSINGEHLLIYLKARLYPYCDCFLNKVLPALTVLQWQQNEKHFSRCRFLSAQNHSPRHLMIKSRTSITWRMKTFFQKKE